jgi:polyisoprenyl-teichoic acid--peptidoglycan teichoic acid transferase
VPISFPADIRRGSEAVRFRRAVVLIGMTLVLPGSAQLVAGNKTVGRLAIRISLGLLLLTVAAYAIVGRDGLLGLAVQSWFLVIGRAVAVVLAAGWLLLFLDAWRLGRPLTLERSHRLVSSGLSLTLAAAVCTPLLYGAHVLGIQRTLLGDLFPEGELGLLDNGRLNVLLLGGDGGKGRTGVRTDSISLASIEVSSGKTVLFSLPRNLEQAPFPDGTPAAKEFPNGFPDFLFGVYTYGASHPDLFPGGKDPGAVAIKQAVGEILGLDVHYYALVNLSGFRELIDALGGITLRVEQRLPIGGVGPNGERTPVTGYVEPGLRKLDGNEALWYARSRRDSSDYDRMSRQRCVMGAILREADPVTVLRNYSDLATSTKHLLETDISRGALEVLVGVAEKTKKTKVSSVQFDRSALDPANPDFGQVRDRVDAAIEKSEQAPEPAPEPAQAKEPATSAPAGGSSGGSAGSSDGTASSAESSGESSANTAGNGVAVDIDDVCRYS